MYLQYRNDISHKIILKIIISQNNINNEQNKHVSSFIVYAYNSFFFALHRICTYIEDVLL